MYSVNEKIILKNIGVCLIEKIEENDFGAGISRYYVIRPVFHDQGSVIRIDVSKDSAIKKMISKEQVKSIIKQMKKYINLWIDDAKKRRTVFKEILVEGDEFKIANLIRTIENKKISLSDNNKQLSMTDKQVLEQAKKFLYEEVATVLDMEFKDVESYIAKKIS